MTEPTLESVLEELKKNLGEEAVEDILAEAELGNSLGIKIAGRKAMPGNAPALNPERQAAVTRAGEIGMNVIPGAGALAKVPAIAKGITAAATAGKNFISNAAKGAAGSTGNVTRDLSGSGRFASPGAASKAGEAVGKTAANPTAQKGAAVAAGVGAVAAVAGGKDDKPQAKADATTGPRKDMPGFKPTPEPSGDDLYKTPESEKNRPSTKFPAPVRPPAKTPSQSDGIAAPSDEPSPGIAAPSDKPTVPRSAPKANMPQKPAPEPRVTPNMPQKAAPEPKVTSNMPTMRNDPGTPGKSAATPENQSNADYWSKEAERNRAQGGKPLPNEFNLFKEEKNFDQFVKKFIKEQK